MKDEKKDAERRSAECSTQWGGPDREGTTSPASLQDDFARGFCSARDRELVQRCIRKDEEAWKEFVARYSWVIQQQIHYSLRARAVSFHREDVEDFSHCVFLAFLKDDSRKLRYFKGKCSLTRWVKTITSHVVIDELRRERSHISLDVTSPEGVSLKDTLPDPHPGAEEKLVHAQVQSILRRAFTTVSHEDRKLALLAYAMEMPVHEISAVLRISKGAVYTRKHRLQQKLRKALGQDQASE